MKVLLEEGVFLENQTKILNTLAEMKISHTLWNCKSYPPYDGKDKNVFFLGSYLTANNLKLAGYQYVLNIGKEYHYSHWASNIKVNVFNDKMILVPAGLVNKLQDILPKSFSKLNINCNKLNGKVRSIEEIENEKYINLIFNEELIMLCPERDINNEYRCIIKSKPNEDNTGYTYSIITSSMYKKDGKETEEYEDLSLKYQQSLVDTLGQAVDFKPHPLFICDVHIDQKGKVKIMNINSIHTSKLYGCDLRLLFDEVRMLNEA